MTQDTKAAPLALAEELTEDLPPLPRPFMKRFGNDIPPEVYEPWAQQMREYGQACILAVADRLTPVTVPSAEPTDEQLDALWSRITEEDCREERKHRRAFARAVLAASTQASQAAPAVEPPSDEVIELAEALEQRRVLEIVKAVAAMRSANDSPTQYDSAWALCCEEIFFRVTQEQWHMDEDATRFARPPAVEPAKREPLVHIPPDSRVGKPPCAECHLQPGERCDICGAVETNSLGAPSGTGSSLQPPSEASAAIPGAEARDPHRGGHSYEASMLRNLLARIHGDGGHYVEQHGLDKAIEDADQLVAKWRAGEQDAS